MSSRKTNTKNVDDTNPKEFIVYKNDNNGTNKKPVYAVQKASSPSKEPFRIGKYMKASGETKQKEIKKDPIFNDIKLPAKPVQDKPKFKSLNTTRTSQKDIAPVKEELYSTSYHSFASLERINLPPPLHEVTSDDSKNEFKYLNLNTDNTKSEAYNENAFSDTSLDKSFESEKTDSFIEDAVSLYTKEEVIDLDQELDYKSKVKNYHILKGLLIHL